MLKIQPHVLYAVLIYNVPAVTANRYFGSVNTPFLAGSITRRIWEKQCVGLRYMRLTRPQHYGVLVGGADAEDEAVTGADRPERLDRVDNRGGRAVACLSSHHPRIKHKQYRKHHKP